MRWRRGLGADGEAEARGAVPTDVTADAVSDGGDDVLPCARCETPLVFVAERDFREGSGGLEFAFGRLGALFGNSTRFEIWACPSCGHVEFFLPGVGE